MSKQLPHIQTYIRPPRSNKNPRSRKQQQGKGLRALAWRNLIAARPYIVGVLIFLTNIVSAYAQAQSADMRSKETRGSEQVQRKTLGDIYDDSRRLDLNQATLEDLENLPGIGPSRAEALIALRDRLGGFRRVQQILRVKGIGRATFRKLQPLIQVAPAKDRKAKSS